ncbi:MAG: hypothetical protein K0R54_639 [Clostridiaceae bacterium]|jgi:hypothetical protein|nr:hypothetical protein [Clostridiaceae bacterium]
MVFERGGDIRESCGEAGVGIYAYVASNNAMRAYYTSNGEILYTLIPNQNSIFLDFTKRELLRELITYMKKYVLEIGKRMEYYKVPQININNYQRFGSIIEDFVKKNYSNVDGWIVRHEGIGIPIGKQVVIKNLNAVNVQKVN